MPVLLFHTPYLSLYSVNLLPFMKQSVNIRNHNYVFESVCDKAFERNSRRAELKAKFHLVFTTKVALLLALVITGADPSQVLHPSSPFMRAANDMWDFMTGTYYKYGQELIFHTFDPRPMVGDTWIAITYYKRENHRPVMITYYNDGHTKVEDMELLNNLCR